MSKIIKTKSLQLFSKKEETLSKRRSLQLPSKITRTPTPVKFSEHANKMIGINTLLNKLPSDLSKTIKKTAFLEKKIEVETILDNSYKNVILDNSKSNLSLKDIINIFQLNHFNFSEKDEYKDDNKTMKVTNNEEILVDISSSISGDTEFTHMYCYKKIKLDNSRNDKYEIILAYIPLNNNENDNNNEEYIRHKYTEIEKNNNIFNIVRPNIQSIRQQLQNRATTTENLINIVFNKEDYINDEYNPEIIKKLKYKDLINIFNPEIEDYSKVIKKLNNIPKKSSSRSRKV